MSCDALKLFAERHSCYELNSHINVSHEDLISIVRDILKIYPSSFNAQSARVLILFGKQHLKLWQLTEEALLKTAPSGKSDAIRKRISSFAQAHGSLLFFDDMNIISNLKEKMPLYAENFANWASQSNAMLQVMIWIALAQKQIGANLQHYNPLIDDAVHKTFETPDSWKLVAQMPFGGITTPPLPHYFEDIEAKLVIKT